MRAIPQEPFNFHFDTSTQKYSVGVCEKAIESIYGADRRRSLSLERQKCSSLSNTPINLAHSLRWKKAPSEMGLIEQPLN